MQNLYGYSEWQAGLCYLPFGVGLMIGSIISGRHSDTVLKTTKSDRIIPELRLRAATPAFFLIPAGFLIYGWTVEYKVGVYAPMIGLFVCKLKSSMFHRHSNDYTDLAVRSFNRRSRTNVGFHTYIRISS